VLICVLLRVEYVVDLLHPVAAGICWVSSGRFQKHNHAVVQEASPTHEMRTNQGCFIGPNKRRNKVGLLGFVRPELAVLRIAKNDCQTLHCNELELDKEGQEFG